MVSVGILGIMSLGIMSMTDYGFKSQAAIEQRFAANSLQSQIYTLLEINKTCNLNFGTLAGAANQVPINAANAAPAPHIVTTINKTNTGVPANDVAYKKYDTASGSPAYENNSIRILSMQIANFQPVGPFPTKDGQCDLILNIEKNKASTGVPQFAPKIIKLKLKLDQFWDNPTPTSTPHKIDTCVAFGGSADQIWTKNPDDTIYYSGANVGIGTNAPQTLLHVKGNGAGANIKVERSNKQMWFDPNQGDGNTFAQIATDVAMGLDFTVNGAFATPAMRISASGDMSIGAQAGAAADGLGPKLIVGGATSDNTDTIFFQRNNSAVNVSELRLSVGDDAIGGVGTDRFIIGAQDSTAGGIWVPKMTVESSGNVGIGTIYPQSKLHLSDVNVPIVESVIENAGGASSQWAAEVVRSYTNNIGAGSAVNFQRSEGTLAAPAAISTAGKLIGSIGFFGRTPGGWGGLGGAASIQVKSSSAFTNVSTPTTLEFSTVPTGSVVNTTRMLIDQNGNVGMGTTAPTEKLQVLGGVAVSGTRVNAVAAGTAVIDFETPNNFMRFNTNNQDIAFNTNSGGNINFERLRIVAATGNVGIGTTAAPTAKLEVNGSIKPGPAIKGVLCGSEGQLAYDYNSHVPVFCNNGTPKVWTEMGVSQTPSASSFTAFGGGGTTAVTYPIAGTWSLCSFSGFKTTADDSNNYDSCHVEQLTPGNWRIVLTKFTDDTLTCYASCVNF